MDNKQETYKIIEVADAIGAQTTINTWAKQGWILDKISFCQKATTTSSPPSTFYQSWYLVVLSKKI